MDAHEHAPEARAGSVCRVLDVVDKAPTGVGSHERCEGDKQLTQHDVGLHVASASWAYWFRGRRDQLGSSTFEGVKCQASPRQKERTPEARGEPTQKDPGKPEGSSTQLLRGFIFKGQGSDSPTGQR